MSLNKNFDNFNTVNFSKFLNFNITNHHVGYVHISFARYLCKYFSNNFVINNSNLVLKYIGNTVEYTNLTKFFDYITTFLFKKRLIKQVTNEYFDVISLNNFTNFFKIERSLLNLFGIVSKGVHLNGYIKKNSKLYIWVAKRSKSKLLYPGKLDNITAGGVSTGYNAFSTLLKEAMEEASIKDYIVKKAVFSTKLHYMYTLKNKKFIRNDIMYIYNLELPQTFIPKKNDGEVEIFLLLPAEEVLNILESGNKEFKFNSAISIIYFLIENKIINQNNLNFKIIKEKIYKMQNSRILKYL